MPPPGTYRHIVSLEGPSGPVDDGEGGWVEGWAPLEPPTWKCSINPATVRSLENVAAGTVITQASHVVTGRYHKGLTTECRILFEGRTFNVLSIQNLEERDRTVQLVCAEVLG